MQSVKEKVNSILNEAIHHINANQTPEARNKCIEGLTIDPQNLDIIQLLASIARNEGNLPEAINLLRKAISYYPNNPDCYINLGIILKAMKHHKVAEEAYIFALKLAPNSYLAYYNLGVLYYEQKLFEKAINNYKKVIELVPNFPLVYNNIATVCLKNDMYDEAIYYSKAAIEFSPNIADGYNNLALAYVKKKELQLAKEYFEKAIVIAPSILAFKAGLGYTLIELGKFQEAITVFEQALDLEVRNNEEAEVKIDLLFHLKRFDHLIQIADLSENDNYIIPYLKKLYFFLLIITYTQGDYSTCSTYLKKSLALPEENFDSSIKWHKIYNDYFYLLINYYYKNQQEYEGLCDNFLYIIGESHSLSPANTIVKYDSNDYKVIAKPIPGCKIWHLISPVNTIYKLNFIQIIKELPANSIVLLAFGEIDCRINEGILTYYKANKDINLNQHIKMMAENYIKYLLESTKEKNLKLIIQGIPAPNIVFNDYDKEDTILFKHIIKTINHELKTASNTYNLKFIDVYTLTVNEDQISNKEYHIDTHHLYPNYLKKILS
jgi:tetratricopeptide (TPR) repeat protein